MIQCYTSGTRRSMSTSCSVFSCFTSLSNIKSLNYKQKQEYTYSWETFRRIELYNSNVSTLHGKGDSGPTYWQFINSTEQADYKIGQSLFFQYLGFSNTVQKN
jgi:hypothetical protein